MEGIQRRKAAIDGFDRGRYGQVIEQPQVIKKVRKPRSREAGKLPAGQKQVGTVFHIGSMPVLRAARTPRVPAKTFETSGLDGLRVAADCSTAREVHLKIPSCPRRDAGRRAWNFLVALPRVEDVTSSSRT